jgi:hypothetical protein
MVTQKMELQRMTLSHLEPLELGGGQVEAMPSGWRMKLPPIRTGYADAQLDDYQPLKRSEFRWRPQLRMTLRARARPAAPSGTLGFGFWNDPFSLSLGQGGAARRLPAAPQAAWFFYGSPPNDMALAAGVPGHGWKASVLRSPPLPSLALLPGAALAAGLSFLPFLRGPVMRLARKFIQAQERILDVRLGEWHQYSMQWNSTGVEFWVDGRSVLSTNVAPRPPLGLVIWIDNQYAVASPEGGFRFGVLETDSEQWLEIENLAVQTSGRNPDD